MNEASLKLPVQLRETCLIGKATRELVVGFGTCPPLNQYRISYTGTSDAAYGFNWVRLNPRMSQVLACIEGSGEVFVNGQWTSCKEGMAYLTPPFVPHAYRAIRRNRWKVCWVFYVENQNQSPIIKLPSPKLIHLNPHPLCSAIEGLYHEFTSQSKTTVLSSWAELIHTYVLRSTEEWSQDDRLWKLWRSVDSNLSYPWSVEELDRIAGVSAEQLRRLSQKQLQQSPMEYVTHLRMRRAAVLLLKTEKIQSIAHLVGYKNAYAFSTAFKRYHGVSPIQYREMKSKKLILPT
jgi:AraC-like DNA-binding protein